MGKKWEFSISARRSTTNAVLIVVLPHRQDSETKNKEEKTMDFMETTFVVATGTLAVGFRPNGEWVTWGEISV